MIDENWDRWIWASILKYVTDQVAAHDPTWFVFIEGTERDTADKPVYVELRLDGPQYKPLQGFTRVEIELDIEVSVQFNKQLYDQNRIAGAIAAIVNNYIPVYKYGNLAGDDETVSIGCLRVDDAVGVDTHKYGQIATKTRLLQGTIQTKYWINL